MGTQDTERPTTGRGWSGVKHAALDAVTDALHRRGVAHESHGNQIRSDCPNCGSTGRPGRRPVIATRRSTGGFLTDAKCGCLLVEIAAALDLPPNALMSYQVVALPSTRNVGKEAKRGEGVLGLSANAHSWGVSLALEKMKNGPGRNLNGVRRVAKDLDRAFATVEPGEWKSYAAARAARDLQMDRAGVRKALRWLVAWGIIEVRQMPAPGDKLVTARGDLVAKSGVKQYRLLTERRQIERLSQRA